MTNGTLILLASNSPRRKELIALGNWIVNLSVSVVDETPKAGEDPADYVLRLAEAKAQAAAVSAKPEHVIVAADTTVVDGRTILGKPTDNTDAVQMLKRLRGHTHQVYTGLAVLKMQNRRLIRDLCVTDVPMRKTSDAEIDAYVRTGDPLDKAGAYAIQNPDFQPVERLSGCYASVMGLPLCHLLRVLHKLDVPYDGEVPARCQFFLHYSCPVTGAILRGEQVG